MLLKNFVKIFETTVRNQATIASFQEIKIPVPWGHIAGKWYGPTSKRPILTLHGWQDNCGSFNRLIPLLNKDVSFLAIDFPGHGLSSRLPNGMFYHFSNYLLLVDYLVNYFKWPKVSLMGHSMGGVTSFTYNMLYPDKVDFLICLDPDWPFSSVNDEDLWYRSLRGFWQQNHFATNHIEPPSYSMTEILEKLSSANNNSIDLEHAQHIADRNIMPSQINPGKYYFSRDPRVRVLDLLMPPYNSLAERVLNITNPVLLITFLSEYLDTLDTSYIQVIEAVKNSEEFIYEKISGKHHDHLNEPEKCAPIIDDFIAKYYEGDEINLKNILTSKL